VSRAHYLKKGLVAMALKRKLAKEDFDKLPEHFKTEYKEKEGAYILDTEDEDAGALLRAKQHEVDARKAAEKKAKDLEDALAAMQDDGARKRGDVEALDKSWNEKHAKVVSEHSEKLSKLQSGIKRRLKESEASKLASEISTVPSIMTKVLLDRLDVDFDGDEPTLKVLDSEGKLSALTLAELKAEILANSELKPILIGNKSSGGSAAGQTPNLSSGQAIDLGKLSPSEMVAYLKSKNK
jgi:hypothetical protein